MEKTEVVIPEIKVNIEGVKLDEELEQPTHDNEYNSELIGDPDYLAEKVNDF